MKRYSVLVLIFVLIFAGIANAYAIAPVHLLKIDGQIDPAVADYIKGGIDDAKEDGAQAVLIVMDTPGGLMTSMQNIVKTFFASKVPVIIFVSPDGATAASAGTFIAIAADIAAMAPVSNIGSASPVNSSPSGGTEEIGPTMKRKVENFAVQYARSIAEKRGRNEDWAEKAVLKAANIKSTTALKMNLIDYIAENNHDLLNKIDGRSIKLATGKTVTLHTAGAPIEERPMGGWETFLHYLSNPYIVLFLSMAAMYGIIFELSNPGAIFPGVIGALSVIMLLYSYSVIPVNAAGFAFIVLAIILFIVDIYAPTHGVLSFGGAVSLFFGLMMLFRSTEGFMVDWWVLAAVTVLTAGFFIFVISLGIKALKKPYISGRNGVVGHIGEARTDLEPTGKIFIDGALWTATSDSEPIKKGEKVEVLRMDGLRLTVRKKTSNDIQ